jgi:Zn-dependent protease/CBS domain-containing protein
MGGSWRIGRIAGIDIYLHFTFLLLLAWVLFQSYMAHRDIAEAISGLIFIVALFSIIVLHELGHALAARRYGIPTRDITLLPIGGVARLERMPDDPKQEFVVALAGPAVNVVLAIGIYLILFLSRGLAPFADVLQVGGGLLNQLFFVNVSLVVFNMLPAFPMDGGRVLRAVLAMRLDYVRATQIAASIGQAMAILFAFVGLFGIPGVFAANPLLLFVAIFVWLGAAQEASMVQMRSALAGIPVQNAMITDFQVLNTNDPLSKAIDYVVAGYQQDFPVLDGEQLLGVVTVRDLVTGLQQYGLNAPVGSVIRRPFVTADPHDMLTTALSRLQAGKNHTIPVIHNGRLLGLLTAENLGEVLMIQEALRGSTGRSAGFPNASNWAPSSTWAHAGREMRP